MDCKLNKGVKVEIFRLYSNWRAGLNGGAAAAALTVAVLMGASSSEGTLDVASIAFVGSAGWIKLKAATAGEA